MKEAAHTDPSPEMYPQFINFKEGEDGRIRVTVRAPSKMTHGTRVCGNTCFPGSQHCNNACGLHQSGGEIPPAPLPFTYLDAGPQAEMSMTRFELKCLLMSMMGW